LIAIVGRPNVGKSALFNRIAGRRIAIVHDQPGVTRDRVSAEVEWRGKPFSLVDTGGIGLLRREKSDDIIVRAALEQVSINRSAVSAAGASGKRAGWSSSTFRATGVALSFSRADTDAHAAAARVRTATARTTTR